MKLEVPWLARPLLDGYPPVISAVQDSESAELQRLAAGRDVLEIGSSFGWSTIAFCLGGALHVTGIDPHEEDPRTWDGMARNMEAYGVADRVTRIRAYSQEALPLLAAEGKRFGLIFIDADHEYPSVRHDLLGSLPLLAPGGLIACHDYFNAPGVQPAVDELFRRPAAPGALAGGAAARLREGDGMTLESAAIIVTAYRRPWYLERTLASWRQARVWSACIPSPSRSAGIRTWRKPSSGLSARSARRRGSGRG